MNRIFKKYENLILLICLLLFAAVLLSNNIKERRQPNFMERAVLAVISPLQGAVTSTIRSMLDAWHHYFYLVDTAEENKKLINMFHEQMFKNNQLREELKKFRRVEEIVAKSPPAVQHDAVVASVVGWDATNTARTLIINRGTGSGVTEGMVVLNHLGLVGRVVNATTRSARVLLITDARSAVDAYVQRTRSRCTVVGQNRGTCEIKYLSVKEDVKDGDVVISSGLGGIYPQGLRLGTITSLDAGSSKLFFKAEMLPSGNFDHLEEIIVTHLSPDANLDLPVAESEEE